MSEDCIATARAIIEAQFANQVQRMDSEITTLRYDLERKGLGHSSVSNKQLSDICNSHLEIRAKFIFETLEQNLIGDCVLTPNLSQDLKVEFSVHLDKHMQDVFGTLEKGLKGERHIIVETVKIKHLNERLAKEYHARIDSLCRRLMNEANKPQQSGTHIGNLNITAPSGNIQIGSHNVQQIHTSIATIAAAIEASKGTPEEKQQAQSRLQSFLKHPLVISILGDIAGGLVKSATRDS